MSSLPALAAPLAAGLGSGKATAPGRDWPGAVFAARAAQPGAKCGFLPNLLACGPRQGWDGLNEVGNGAEALVHGSAVRRMPPDAPPRPARSQPTLR